MDGFVVIDKPKGPTSHQIDYWVREITGEPKVGHIGTLDPNVTGVLVMALGRAVKLIDIVHEYPKEYVFIVKFHGSFDTAMLSEVSEKFTGRIYQIPPMRSAVARSLRVREIYSIETLEISDRNVLMKVKCQSGTYIRTLCTDMGYVMGTGAQMVELRRTITGPFNETDLVTLQDLSDAVKLSGTGDSSALRKMLIPMDYIFKDTPKIIVKKSALRNISHGSDLFPGGIRALIGNPEKGDRVCVMDENNELVGTGKMLVSYHDIGVLKVLDFDRILLDPIESGGKIESGRKDILVRKEEGRRSLPVQKPQRQIRGNTYGTQRRKGSASGGNSGRRNSRPERGRTGIRKKKNRS